MPRTMDTPVSKRPLDWSAREPDANRPWLEQVIGQNRVLCHGLLAFLAFCTLVSYYVPPLVRADVYTDDMREHIAWYQAAKNPALFQDDIMKTYFTAMCPLGYKALFSTVCAYVDPQVLGEVLALVLGMAGVWLAYKLGAAATSGSALGGIAAVLLLLFGHIFGLHEFIKVFQGGLQRAFALPIFMLGTWALLCGRMWSLSAALILGALFFPPACVGLAAFSASVAAVRVVRSGSLRSLAGGNFLVLAAALILSAALLLLTRAVTASHGHWTVYTLRDALKMPEFFAGGVWDQLWNKPILYHSWSDYLLKAITVPRPVLLILTTLFFFWRTAAFRTEVGLLIASTLGTWILAYLTLFYLYEPSRYILYPLMTLWLIVLPCATLEVIKFLEPKLQPLLTPLARVIARHKTGFAFAFVVLAATATTCLTASRIRNREGGMTGTAPAEVYDFLRALPETTRIAANPIDADDIPMRSQRTVLAFAKAMCPYHREFYEEMIARITATWTAMYATNCDDILQLKRRYGADVLLIDEAWYKHDTYKAEPCATILESCKKNLRGGAPLVLRLPGEVVAFRSGSFRIIDLAALDRFNRQRLQAGP